MTSTRVPGIKKPRLKTTSSREPNRAHTRGNEEGRPEPTRLGQRVCWEEKNSPLEIGRITPRPTSLPLGRINASGKSAGGRRTTLMSPSVTRVPILDNLSQLSVRPSLSELPYSFGTVGCDRPAWRGNHQKPAQPIRVRITGTAHRHSSRIFTDWCGPTVCA